MLLKNAETATKNKVIALIVQDPPHAFKKRGDCDEGARTEIRGLAQPPHAFKKRGDCDGICTIAAIVMVAASCF